MTKTSDTHPLRIDAVQGPFTKGTIGMTFCPGKKGQGLYSGGWNRDLEKDFSAIREWGADVLVSLVEDHEFELLCVNDFKERAAQSSFEWLHLPIVDVSVPDAGFERSWRHYGNIIHGILMHGGKVVLHCRGGLGRTGLVAARLLVDFGMDSGEAIKAVRSARPGTIETLEQEQHVHEYKKKNLRRNLDSFLGCLLGGAVGDALGAPIEFNSLAEIRKKYGPSGIQTYNEAFGKIGAITDDTQMTLFTAEGMLRGCTRANERGIGPVFANVIYYAYLRWLVTQGELDPDKVEMDGWLIKSDGLFSRRAPGNTCLSALKSRETYFFKDVQNNNTSKGCGAVMRVAPIGLFLHSPYLCGIWDADRRDSEAFTVGRDTGYLTHGHPSGYLPAAFLAMLIGRIIDGDDLNAALDRSCGVLARQENAEETLAAIDRARQYAADSNFPPCAETIEQLGCGWVGEEALAISIYCALVAKEDFDFGVRLAVNHSGDSDSTGAITGNILGALLGRNKIADHWLDQLELREVIERIAIDTFIGYRGGDEWWDLYPGY